MDRVRTETNSAVALFECPIQGISRAAMIGPTLPIDHETDITTRCLAVKCLVAASEGDFASCLSNINLAQLHSDPSGFWRSVALDLDHAKNLQPTPPHSGVRVRPADCFSVLCGTAYWYPRPSPFELHPIVKIVAKNIARETFGNTHELSFDERLSVDLRAQKYVDEQVQAGVIWTLSALQSELLEIVIQFPHLSIAMVSKILGMAEKYSAAAKRYAIQAIKNEPVGLLTILASGEPAAEAEKLRFALFSGSSIPIALESLGIPKAVHKVAVRRPLPLFLDAVPDPVRLFTDLPLSGQAWIAAMKLTRHLPLSGRSDWEEFCRLVTKFHTIQFRDPEQTTEALFEWCLQRGYVGACDRLEILIANATKIVSATKNLAFQNIPLDVAVSAILVAVAEEADGFHLSESNRTLAQTLRTVAKISGNSAGALTQIVFDAHPGVPKTFDVQNEVELLALDSLETAIAHGNNCENCLSLIAGVLQYVAKGHALYAVRFSQSGDVFGTIALNYNGPQSETQVSVSEARGVKNAEAPPLLLTVAQNLARSFRTNETRQRWVSFKNQCLQWCRFAGQP